MKIFILNTLRIIAYTVVSLFTISSTFWIFEWSVQEILYGLSYLQATLNPFLFWIGLIAFGLGIIKLLLAIFSFISSILTFLTTLICPYKGYAIWISSIFSILSLCIFMRDFWLMNKIDSVIVIIIGIIVSILALILSYDIVINTINSKKVMNHYKNIDNENII